LIEQLSQGLDEQDKIHRVAWINDVFSIPIVDTVIRKIFPIDADADKYWPLLEPGYDTLRKRRAGEFSELPEESQVLWWGARCILRINTIHNEWDLEIGPSFVISLL